MIASRIFPEGAIQLLCGSAGDLLDHLDSQCAVAFTVVHCEPRYRNDRPGFASGVAEALIKVGVRCVIAAGWAVEDIQAMAFAQTFYQHLLAGERFIHRPRPQ